MGERGSKSNESGIRMAKKRTASAETGKERHTEEAMIGREDSREAGMVACAVVRGSGLVKVNGNRRDENRATREFDLNSRVRLVLFLSVDVKL